MFVCELGDKETKFSDYDDWVSQFWSLSVYELNFETTFWKNTKIQFSGLGAPKRLQARDD